MIYSYLLKNLIYANLLTITLFSCGDNLKSLEHDMEIVLRRFKFTYSESGKVSIYDSSEIPTVKILSYNRAN